MGIFEESSEKLKQRACRDKQQAEALTVLKNSEGREYLKKLSKEIMPVGEGKEEGEILSQPQVVEMVKGKSEVLPDKKSAERIENEELEKEAKQFKEKESPGIAERYRQRAITK